MAEDSLSDETLDFIFDFVRDAPDQQLASADALDSKMVQVFAVAGVIVGLAAAGLSSKSTVVGLILAVSIAAFVVAAVASGYALWVREMRSNRHADEIWRDYWNEPPREIKHAIVADTADAYSANKRSLERKARAMRAAFLAAGVEVVLVGFALVWSTWS